MDEALHIVGGGMAGAEAAWAAAGMGVRVVIHEMRPHVATFAHRSGDLAEMVCSNSFRSDDDERNAVGLLHWEMDRAASLVMATARAHRVPAGGALAVDREPFAAEVTARIRTHPLIAVTGEEVRELPSDGRWIVATGPLTSDALGASLRAVTGSDALAFFDAMAPIVHADSIDLSVAWMQSRYDKGDTEAERTAYVNCPMTKDQYEGFVDALLAADKTAFHEGETAGYFDGCLPIEVMAERGRETLRFGPMKPVGLTDAHGGPKALRGRAASPRQRAGHALQHRGLPDQDDPRRAGRGAAHRPRPARGAVRPAGRHPPQHLHQRADASGRAACGSGRGPTCASRARSPVSRATWRAPRWAFIAGRMAAAEMLGRRIDAPPPETAMGALVTHITGGAEAATFQPMNVNFGLFPPIDAKGGRRGRKDRYKAYTDRAKEAFAAWAS